MRVFLRNSMDTFLEELSEKFLKASLEKILKEILNEFLKQSMENGFWEYKKKSTKDIPKGFSSGFSIWISGAITEGIQRRLNNRIPNLFFS